MIHPEMSERMMRALDRELNVGETRELLAHLQECASCAGHWDALRGLETMLTGAPVMAPGAGFTERVLTQLQARERRSERVRSLVGIIVLTLASSTILGLVFMETPLFSLARPDGMTALISGLVAFLTAVSTLSSVLGTFLQTISDGLGEMPIVILAVLALALAVLWGRIVMGPVHPLAETMEWRLE